jgi:serine/threonine protein kinase
VSEANGTTDPEPGAPDRRLGSIVDKYTIVRLLGQGGMGAVYEARHATLSRRFAIKFLLPQLAEKREILRRFENEAKAAGGLEHPNLAAVTDFGRATDGAPYIVMEFLQGEDCSGLLRRLGQLPIHRAADIVVQACRGLAVAHRAGIVHRDLKPENLFLSDAGDGSDMVKVLDFGIAKLRSAEGSLVTSTGATFGTAHYMSPEQARGASEVDQRTDVWSAGVVLYELLSGRTPFPGEQFLHVIHEILTSEPVPLTSLRSGLPRGIMTAVSRALTKDVSRRLPTVMALAEALTPFAKRDSTERAVAGPSAVRTRPTPPTDVEQESAVHLHASSRRLVAVGIGVAALALSLALVFRSHLGAPAPSVAAPISASSAPQKAFEPPTSSAHGSPSIAPVVAPLPTPVRSQSEQSEPGSDKGVEGSDRAGNAVQRRHRPKKETRSTGGTPPAPRPVRNDTDAPKPPSRSVTIDPGNPY